MKTFVIADCHWGHKGVCHFKRADGTPLRPWNNPDAMDKAMVEYWNDVVGEKDKVYVLGDWCINRKALAIGHQLKGRKVLIKGNHDIFKLEDYTPFFYDIRACHVLKGQRFILTHIPVHENQLHRYRANIHGHLHSNKLDDERYECVSVEHTNFRPILLDEVIDKINTRLGTN